MAAVALGFTVLVVLTVLVVTVDSAAEVSTGDTTVVTRDVVAMVEATTTTTTIPPTTTTVAPTTTTTVPTPTTTTVPPAVSPPPNTRATTHQPTGSCGGWGATIAAYFPADEVGTACRVMLCESGGNPSAHNPSGASGLFQVMPGWADEYQGVTGVPYYDGRFNGDANTRFAAWLQGEGGWGHWACY
jgi:hypothetical protein